MNRIKENVNRGGEHLAQRRGFKRLKPARYETRECSTACILCCLSYLCMQQQEKRRKNPSISQKVIWQGKKKNMARSSCVWAYLFLFPLPPPLSLSIYLSNFSSICSFLYIKLSGENCLFSWIWHMVDDDGVGIFIFFFFSPSKKGMIIFAKYFTRMFVKSRHVFF